jgi:hypothetical protein
MPKIKKTVKGKARSQVVVKKKCCCEPHHWYMMVCIAILALAAFFLIFWRLAVSPLYISGSDSNGWIYSQHKSDYRSACNQDPMTTVTNCNNK